MNRLRTVVEESRCWNSRGVVKMSEDEHIRINLIDSWHKQKVSGHVYPLGIEDSGIVDETCDDMHRDGKLDWMLRPTPFGCPVFVAWRIVNGVRKGRVVVDLPVRRWSRNAGRQLATEQPDNDSHSTSYHPQTDGLSERKNQTKRHSRRLSSAESGGNHQQSHRRQVLHGTGRVSLLSPAPGVGKASRSNDPLQSARPGSQQSRAYGFQELAGIRSEVIGKMAKHLVKRRHPARLMAKQRCSNTKT
ncbi:uncharacterized protein B0H64DRAFT_177208 [Chaetomium fimeti]|uniref:Uncharacterized protein n=1 Tax=Chaetomium fimeti TaxID=1854472 RepID=A0AAE0HE63_9PEZI|nr:hypothetical protein B0H64DRAFT_177208 [Chaetomium fimeti]